MKADPTADEIRRLQSGLNDLVSVLAMPAIWTGRDTSQVATALLDALVELLRLDFAYVRIPEQVDEPARGWLRTRPDEHPQSGGSELGGWVESWLTTDERTAMARVPNPLAPGLISVVVLKLGLHDTMGVLVAGAEREAFPNEIERLLLQVSTNLAAIALQEARHASDQQRTAAALEREVVKQTAELRSVNDTLR